MAEENKKVEETKVEEPKKPETKKVDLRAKAKELKNNVTKIDLSNPPQPKGEEAEKQPAIEEDVVVINEEPKVEEPKEEIKDEVVVEDVTNEQGTRGKLLEHDKAELAEEVLRNAD